MKIYSMTSKDVGKKSYGKKLPMYILYVKDLGQELTDIDQRSFSVFLGSTIAPEISILSGSFLQSCRSDELAGLLDSARNGRIRS